MTKRDRPPISRATEDQADSEPEVDGYAFKVSNALPGTDEPNAGEEPRAGIRPRF